MTIHELSKHFLFFTSVLYIIVGIFRSQPSSSAILIKRLCVTMSIFTNLCKELEQTHSEIKDGSRSIYGTKIEPDRAPPSTRLDWFGKPVTEAPSAKSTTHPRKDADEVEDTFMKSTDQTSTAEPEVSGENEKERQIRFRPQQRMPAGDQEVVSKVDTKRKRVVSEADKPAWAVKQHRTSEPESEDEKASYLCSLSSLPGYLTPKSYHHGPRYESQNGPLMTYKNHTAILKGKLLALEIDKRELDDDYANASRIHKEASRRLREHNADQGYYLDRRGGIMSEWKRVESGMVRSLKGAEAAMERARTRAEQRRIRLKIDEDDEAEGWGPATMAEWY